MKRMHSGACLLGLLAVLAVGPMTASGTDYTWTGAADTSWKNTNNWLVAGLVPTNCPGEKAGGSRGDSVIFGVRGGGANDPYNNVYDGSPNRIGGMEFKDAWTLNMGEELYVGDGDGWINMSGGTNAGISQNRKLLFYNQLYSTVTAGNTLTIGPTMEFLVNGRFLNWAGGGTIKVTGSMSEFDKERNDLRSYVSGSGTTLELDSKLWLGAIGGDNQVSAGNVAADSILSGNGGGISAGGAAGGRTYEINGTIRPGTPEVAVGTLDFAGIQTFNLNGTYAVDITASNSDKITASALVLGADSKLVVSGTGSAAAYEIATYTNLTGTFKESASVLPTGYMLDYAYGGTNTIVLVKKLGGTIITVK